MRSDLVQPRESQVISSRLQTKSASLLGGQTANELLSVIEKVSDAPDLSKMTDLLFT
ncbi:hypothetical protein GCM10008927_06170 [Amylibacter ulvae]|uniref:Uncharacterized protein n=1 Tax=Paramylibacter ulvae TaxID=1651968 RepID=A0ABQ3CUQ5_9RHOB|nr:hypothetical protein GCM10008927_06170 [Amylibacter ulvae]